MRLARRRIDREEPGRIPEPLGRQTRRAHATFWVFGTGAHDPNPRDLGTRGVVDHEEGGVSPVMVQEKLDFSGV